MKCENHFCIYQTKGDCTLDAVSIDGLGMCTECLYPDIDETALNKAKAKTFKALQKPRAIK